MSIVLPGHVLTESPHRIGPGLYASGNPPVITALRAGHLVFTHRKPHPDSSTQPSSSSSTQSTQAAHSTSQGAQNGEPGEHSQVLGRLGTALVDSSTRRYVPAAGDFVICTVTARFADGYRVSMGSSLSATLDSMAFENVNRKSRQNVPVGGTVYARTVNVVPGADVDVVCVNEQGKSGGFGVLSGGFILDASLGLCRRLLNRQDVVLASIGEKAEYEVVVGVNGKIWISADERKLVLMIAKIIKEVEFLTEGETRSLIARRLKEL